MADSYILYHVALTIKNDYDNLTTYSKHCEGKSRHRRNLQKVRGW